MHFVLERGLKSECDDTVLMEHVMNCLLFLVQNQPMSVQCIKVLLSFFSCGGNYILLICV